MYIGKVPKKRFVFPTQEIYRNVPDTWGRKQTIYLSTRSGFLQDIAVFCTKALTHCTTRTLNWQAQPLDISVWVYVLKSWRVLSERLKHRCQGYPRPSSSQSSYRTQTLTAKEKEFLMRSLTWIQMVHNTSVLPQLKLHPEKAPPVSQQSSVCLLSMFSLTFCFFFFTVFVAYNSAYYVSFLAVNSGNDKGGMRRRCLITLTWDRDAFPRTQILHATP